MNYRQLGRSSISLSEIGFGCMSLPLDETVVDQLLHRAVLHGINFFDTADLYQYGENERIVGKALKPIRKQVILATKVGNQWRSDGSGWDWNPSKEYILSAVDKSLLRLQTDYIDLYQLHGGTIEDPIDDILEAFEQLKEKGKIRFYGISSIRPNVVREYVEKSSISSVMMQYSLLDRRPEESCLPLLRDKKISVLARGVLAKGLLINKTPTPFLNYEVDSVEKIQHKIQELSARKEIAEHLSIRWALREEAITSAVIGIRTADQLELAVAASHSGPIEDHIVEELNSQLPANYYDIHR